MNAALAEIRELTGRYRQFEADRHLCSGEAAHSLQLASDICQWLGIPRLVELIEAEVLP